MVEVGGSWYDKTTIKLRLSHLSPLLCALLKLIMVISPPARSSLTLLTIAVHDLYTKLAVGPVTIDEWDIPLAFSQQ